MVVGTGGAVIVGGVQIPHDPASARVVRHRLATELAGHGITPESVEEVVLVTSELVGNAIRHTPAPESGLLHVQWHVDERDVVVSVADAGPERPRLREPADNEPGGRGLTIVDALAAEWGVAPPLAGLGTGKQVWARIPIRRARAFS